MNNDFAIEKTILNLVQSDNSKVLLYHFNLDIEVRVAKFYDLYEVDT